MKVVAIHLAPATRLPVRAVESVDAEAGKGLVGDRYHGTRHRHVTIQSREFLDRAAEDLGYTFDCGATRRNITVDSGEIPTQPGTRVHIGDVELEVVRVALRRRAGSVCQVLSSGTIRVGAAVEVNSTSP